MKIFAVTVLLAALIAISVCTSNRSSSPAEPLKSAVVEGNKTATSNTVGSAKVFDLDLIGQSVRIASEGLAEEQIRRNLVEIDKTITYEHLKKNADKHAGKPWAFSGKILEITEKDGITEARIALDDWGNKVIYVAGPIETLFVEKNRVYVIGYLAGNHSYTSQANWKITVPALAVRAMIKPQDLAKYLKGKK